MGIHEANKSKILRRGLHGLRPNTSKFLRIGLHKSPHKSPKSSIVNIKNIVLTETPQIYNTSKCFKWGLKVRLKRAAAWVLCRRVNFCKHMAAIRKYYGK